MITILKKTDITLIALLLIIASIFYFVLRIPGEEGGVVIVSMGGVPYRKLPLSEEREVEIILSDGTHSNTLIIRDGEAYMSYADCPDGLCLKRGPVRLTGETIVCVPNRIVVEVSGGDAEFDAVAG